MLEGFSPALILCCFNGLGALGVAVVDPPGLVFPGGVMTMGLLLVAGRGLGVKPLAVS